MPNVSVVMTSYNRADLLEATLTSIFAQKFADEIIVVDDGEDRTPQLVKALQLDEFPIRHIALRRAKSETYRNPALPNNVGVRHATGDIIVLQNAECKHVDPNTLQKLTAAVTDTNVAFAKVIALHANGIPDIEYCSRDNPRPYFFCGAIKKAWFDKLRGFDEDFKGYGYDDDDFADRLRAEGVTFDFTDIEVHHQWHPSAGKADMAETSRLYAEKTAAMKAGALGTVRNLQRCWGAA